MKDNIQNINVFYESFSEFLITGKVENISKFLDSGVANSPDKILLIYRNGYLKSCIDALKNSFEVTLKVLGNDQFSKIAKEYVLMYPPRQGTLVGYGSQFPEYLLSHCSASYISELAKLDQTWLNTLNSRQTDGLTAGRITQLDDQNFDIFQLNVALTDGCYIVELEFQAFEAWEKIKRVGEVAAIDELSNEANSVLFWKSNDQVNARELLSEEAEFFRQIKLGKTLGESASHIKNIYANANIAEIFSKSLENNLLIERKTDGIIN